MDFLDVVELTEEENALYDKVVVSQESCVMGEKTVVVCLLLDDGQEVVGSHMSETIFDYGNIAEMTALKEALSKIDRKEEQPCG